MPSLDPLARLLDVLQPSLAMYLADSGLWSYPGRESIKLALADVVTDQRSILERAAVALEDRGVVPSAAVYPIAFTGCHDVDMKSLLPRVVSGMRGQLAAIESILTTTAHDAVADELAREARATTLGHIDVLEQVASTAP